MSSGFAGPVLLDRSLWASASLCEMGINQDLLQGGLGLEASAPAFPQLLALALPLPQADCALGSPSPWPGRAGWSLSTREGVSG